MFSVLKKSPIALVFIVAASFIYSNTLEAPFVFDDKQNILDNHSIRISEITIDSLSKAVFGKKTNSLRPCTRITFALNYYFHRYSLKGYHLVNIVIHILSGILFYFFLKKTLSIPSIQSRYNNPALIALSAALLWIVHPLHTQSVTYIVQRMNSMSAMFYILSILLYVAGRTHQQELIAQSPLRTTKTWFYFSGAFVSWLMAIGSKENAAVLPFFIFLYEWYFFQNLDRVWLKRNIKIFFLIIILFGITAFIFMGPSPFERIQTINDFKNQHFTFMERVLTQPRVIIYYITLLFYPHPSRLNIDYDFPLSHSLIDPATTFFSCFVIISLIGAAVCLAKQERIVSFCIIWFLGNLAIESSVIPLAVIFEHRTYLPSMMICLLPVIIGQRHIPVQWIVNALLCIALFIFSFWTYQRNSIWNNPAALWSSCVKNFPNKARPHNNLGNALEKQGSIDVAIKHYHEALRLKPDYEDAHNNMGNALIKQNHIDEAVKHFKTALRINPHYVHAYINLAGAFLKQNRIDEAIQHSKEALRLNTHLSEAHYNLGLAFSKLNRVDESIQQYRMALRINPDYEGAHNNIGNALIKRGHFEDAIQHYKETLRINPDHAEAHNNLGNALTQQNRIDEAVKQYKEALRINPNYVDAHNNLGIALAYQGDINSAIQHFKRALQIHPEDPGTENNLQKALDIQRQSK